MSIQRNLNPSGRVNNMGFGLCAIADGLVRVVSLGLFHTTLTLDFSRETALRRMKSLKSRREA